MLKKMAELAARFDVLATEAWDDSPEGVGRAGAFRNVAGRLRTCQTVQAALTLAVDGSVASDEWNGRSLWGGEIGTAEHARWVRQRNGVRDGYAEAVTLLRKES